MSNPRAYRLRRGEPLPEGIARVAWGRVDDAIAELDGSAGTKPVDAVHNARKDIKKLRALVRLVRGELGSGAARRENSALRDTAALLAGARDADVMLATLDRLELDEADAGPLRQALEAHRMRVAAPRAQAGVEAIEALSAVRRRVGEWPIERDSFQVLAPGLRRTYRRGRRAFRALREAPTVEGLHDWRKRVKDLWYHHELLRFAWKPVMRAYAEEAHVLSERLGEDHDLAMLLAWAREHARAPDALVEAVESRRRRLQAQAIALGERLYAEPAGDFVSRLEGWWESARRAP